MPIANIQDIITDMRAGRMVILVDEEDRENEGDLVLAADHVSAQAINFMARFGRGLICLTLTRERCERLKLAPMATQNGTRHGTVDPQARSFARPGDKELTCACQSRGPAPPRLYAHRIARRDRDHRHPCRPAVAGPFQSQGPGAKCAMHFR